MVDHTDDFDIRPHQEMWHNFIKLAQYGLIGITGLLIFYPT